MVKLKDQIVSALMNKNLDANKKLYLISSIQQRFNKLTENTNTLNGDSAVKNVTVANAPKVEALKTNSNKRKPRTDHVTDKVKPVKNKKQHAKNPQPNKVDKLINNICNNPQIIRRNNANKLKVNSNAVPG